MINSADELLQDGEKSLFAQAKESGNKQKICDGIKTFFDDYNNDIKTLKKIPRTMNDFYRNMLVEATGDSEESLSRINRFAISYNLKSMLFSKYDGVKVLKRSFN